MKRWILLETAACFIALVGVLIFGFAIFPCVNPIQYRLSIGTEYLFVSLLCLPISILVMWIAWRLTLKAQRLKQASTPPEKTE